MFWLFGEPLPDLVGSVGNWLNRQPAGATW
jgi:hypothetical protein